MQIKIPKKFEFLLKTNARFKVAYGGRGGGKSENFARALLMLALKPQILFPNKEAITILCVREYQSSISHSVHKAFSDIISLYNLNSYFTITNTEIRSINGSKFQFKGISNDPLQIKSTFSIDLCWCFVAGTLIDNKKIENIKKGDFVYSFNHKKNIIEKRMVLKIMKRKAPKVLYKLLTSYGSQSIIGTAEHPIYVKNKGYVPLSKVVKGDIIYASKKRFTIASTLFGRLWRVNSNKYKKSQSKIYEKWWDKLLGLCKKSNIKKNAGRKSNGKSRIKEKTWQRVSNTFNGGCGQWSWLSRATKNISKKIRKGLVDRISSANWLLLWRQWIANKLQNRYSKCLFWYSDRNRWKLTSRIKRQRRRQQKEFILTEQRVESVEVQEQSGNEKFRCSDGGDYVYNFEVEGNNNYFANGLLVHNCEEGEKVSKESWNFLTPTIRNPNSEIWVSFNPNDKNDPTYKMFIDNPLPDTVSVKVNYYDNPYFDLSPIKAEMLYDREHNPELYQNKWLGEVKQLSDALIFKGKYQVKEFETPPLEKVVDNRYFIGVDFGFSSDAFAVIRCFIVNDELFIDYEAGGVGISIVDLKDHIAKIPEAKKWIIYADNARPETINHIRVVDGYNIRPCEKGKGSVEDGIEHLRSYKKIIIHPRCVNIINEFGLYCYKVDKTTGEILPIIVDKHNHYIDALRYSLTQRIKKRVAFGILNY